MRPKTVSGQLEETVTVSVGEVVDAAPACVFVEIEDGELVNAMLGIPEVQALTVHLMTSAMEALRRTGGDAHAMLRDTMVALTHLREGNVVPIR